VSSRPSREREGRSPLAEWAADSMATMVYDRAKPTTSKDHKR
jgi:hypothetical protein